MNLSQYCFCFMFWLPWPQVTRDLSFLTRDPSCTLCSIRWGLNHWTAGKSPTFSFLIHTNRAEVGWKWLWHQQSCFSTSLGLQFPICENTDNFPYMATYVVSAHSAGIYGGLTLCRAVLCPSCWGYYDIGLLKYHCRQSIEVLHFFNK